MIARKTNNILTFPTTEQSHRIAMEHYDYCCSRGMGDAEIMQSIGLSRLRYPNRIKVIDCLRRTWLAMQCGWKL